MKREYMIERRKALRMTRDQMARRLQISPKLVEMLEEDENCVTHPEIVKVVARAYRLTKQQKTMMLPENYRPGPHYNPDRYKLATDPTLMFKSFKITARGDYY